MKKIKQLDIAILVLLSAIVVSIALGYTSPIVNVFIVAFTWGMLIAFYIAFARPLAMFLSHIFKTLSSDDMQWEKIWSNLKKVVDEAMEKE